MLVVMKREAKGTFDEVRRRNVFGVYVLLQGIVGLDGKKIYLVLQ